MSGHAPQPGETPQSESAGEPSWWHGGPDPASGSDPNRPRHPRRRAPQAGALLPQQEQEYGPLLPQQEQEYGPLLPQQEQEYAAQAAEARPADARSAAAQDVARELDPAIKQRTATEAVTHRVGDEAARHRPADEAAIRQRGAEETVKHRGADELRTEPGGVEHDHNRPDAYRYDPLRPPAGYPRPTEAAATLETEAEEAQAEAPQQPEPPATPEPDVMLLPEPDARNRPTVPLENGSGSVPGQGRLRPAEPLPGPTGDPATDARLEKLENSPFWSDDPERAGTRRLPEVSSHAGGGGRRVRKGAIRKPAPALLALITLALVATFFAWVSAEPFWLAVGHGDRGYATTTACRGAGVVQRCAGRFEAADGSFAVARVTLLGVAADKRTSGTVVPARMVSAGSRTAYAGDTGPLVQLRWVLGFLLVLICGYGIAGLTGARRLDDPRARRLVLLGSVFAPIVLLVGFLAASY
jgi:hypothetical protein